MTRKRYERIDVGIERAHATKCRYLAGKDCHLGCPYRAEVYDSVTKRRQKRMFDSLREARRWREDKRSAMRVGTHRVMERATLQEAWDEWLEAAVAGVVKSSDGDDYKPEVLRNYASKMKNYILPRFGGAQLSELRLRHVQDLVDELVGKGQAPKTVRNTIIALRAVVRWAIRRELLTVDPCQNLALPSGETARERVAPVTEALELIGALERADDRALWAMAFFTGLRRGELLALDWSNVDLVGQRLYVERSYDNATRPDHVSRNDQILEWLPGRNGAFIKPKSKKGYRWVPIPALLLPYLLALDRTEGLVFGDDGVYPAHPAHTTARARAAWKKAGLEPITLHNCRHTYVSMLIAAGVRIDIVSEKIGHASVTITLDRYRHLLPGTDDEAREQFDAYLTTALEA